ncbi:MAG: GNAT family N-acetyltransferase [Phototrophicales bacterium]|nr:MAG: GNAT family N-acetyltransferase [Phototrophicales bacterium]
MNLIRFDDANRFYERVSPFLSAREAEHNLLLGIIRGVQIGEYTEYPPYLGCIEADNQVVAVIVRTPPHHALLSLMDKPHNIIPLIVENMRHEYPSLAGVIGAKLDARIFAETWEAATGQPFWLGVRQRIYKLTQVTFPQHVAGELRWATEADFNMLVNWYIGFIKDAGLTITTPDRAQSIVRRYLDADPKERRLAIWQVDGVPVSMSGYMGSTPNGMRVGAVYTPAEHRKKGYASACVAHLSQHILDMGKQFSFLFTDLANSTSNHIYQAIGYQPISDVDEYRFTESTL